MHLHIRPVGKQNWEKILSLHVKNKQEHFIGTTSQFLAEADKLSVWRPVGIYDEDTLIGFAMYGLFMDYPPNSRVWLNRLLIDVRIPVARMSCGFVSPLIPLLNRCLNKTQVMVAVVGFSFGL
ncbi:MAG: spermidine acetyltransferase [Negativibacillus sp.]